MKIRTVILLLSLCYACTSSAQKNSFKEKNSIDFLFGYDVVFQQVDHLLDQQNIYIKPKSALRLGFNYNYKLARNLYLKTGLRYANPGYERTFYKVPIISNSTEITLRDQSVNYQIDQIKSYKYHLIETPLMLRYVYSSKCVKTYIEGGISSNVYLGSHVKTNLAQSESEMENGFEKEALKKVHLAAHFSFGADVLTWNQCALFIQLNTKYSLQNIREENYQEKHISLGWQSGVRYHF